MTCDVEKLDFLGNIATQDTDSSFPSPGSVLAFVT